MSDLGVGRCGDGFDNTYAAPRRPLWVLVFVLVVALAGACGGADERPTVVEASGSEAVPTPSLSASESSSAGATEPTYGPTEPTEPEPPGTPGIGSEYQTSGPYEVGVVTLMTPGGVAVEVYYPATGTPPGSTDTYRVRSYLPDAIAAIIPTDVDDSFTIDAARNGTPAAGRYPVVLFSHGFSAFRTQSSQLLRQMASWGMVAAAPDHSSRNLRSQLGEASATPTSALEDLRATRALLESEAADGTALGQVIDTSRVALAGHSAGGGTVLQMAGDPGIVGFISYASGGTEIPAVPSLFMAGALDEVVPPQRTSDAFAAATDTSWLWTIDEAGHLAFSDLCAIGDGEGGLIGLAEAAGIGALVPDNLRRLATDGCEDPNLPVAEVWPAVNQASIGFLRFVFGEDDTPRGIDAIALDGVDLTIDANIG